MPPLVSPQLVSRISEWPFAANIARIRDDFRDLDPRLMKGVRLGLAALAGFSFAVTFVAGSRAPHSPQPGLPPTPVLERASDFGPALASGFERIRTLPDLLPIQAVAPTATASRPTATPRPVTATAPVPTSFSAVPAPPVAQPVRRRIVSQPTAPPAPRPSRPAPAPQTFDSSGNSSFDSSG
jgi:hypothetical protein